MVCPSCRKPLRKDNSRGACAECISAGKAPRKAAESVRRRFTAATAALGVNGDGLIEKWMGEWLANAGKYATTETE